MSLRQGLQELEIGGTRMNDTPKQSWWQRLSDGLAADGLVALHEMADGQLEVALPE